MNYKARQDGFTLIELLIVIAIIAIIAALLFPVFANVRKKSQQAVCLSNARQMSLALQEYTADYDDHYMTRHDNDAGNVGPGIDPNPADFQTWYDWVQPYIKSYDVQRCPSFGGPYPIPNIVYPSGSPVIRYCKSTYLISDNILTTGGVVRGALANIPNPSSTILVAESPSGNTYFAEAGTGLSDINHQGPTGVDFLLCPGFSASNVPNGSGSMHFVESIPNGFNFFCNQNGAPEISARVTCIAADGHAKSVFMNGANDGSVTADAQGHLHDPPGGYGGLYFTGPDGELSFP